VAVAARSRRALAPERGFRRVLVPVVDTPASLRAVEVACRLAAESHSSVSLVTVIELPPLLPLGAHMLEEEAAARDLLERAETIAEERGVHVSTRILRARDAGLAIAELLEKSPPELIVVGATRGAHGKLGRTVRHLLTRAPSRVLLVAATSPAARGT
jgi:nucleotide-binding universal stress UspA family protein